MCVTSDLAELLGTKIYLGQKITYERLINVLAYQNKPVNLSTGPNAMILHIPARAQMTQANNLNTQGCGNLLDDMIRSTIPVTRSGGMSKSFSISERALVYESGIYTIVQARNADAVYDALSRVPTNKRPIISRELLQYFNQTYKGWTIQLCCFDNKDTAKADPLMWWYEPMDTSTFVLPGIDSHDGGVPNFQQPVNRDTYLIFGSDNFPRGIGHQVDYTDNIPSLTRSFLPEKVIATSIRGNTPNGDFVLSGNDVAQNNLSNLRIC